MSSSSGDPLARLARATVALASRGQGAGPEQRDVALSATLMLACAKVDAPGRPVELAHALALEPPPRTARVLASIERTKAGRELASAIDELALGADDEDAIHALYEGLLARIDPETRAARGVYVTPRALVRYVVASASELVRSELGLTGGLLDDVRVLDPATGTGSFLAAVIEETARARPRPAQLRALARRLSGLDILAAPLAAAGFHVRRALARAGAGGVARLDLRQGNALAKGDSEELARRGPLLVLGNPPYSRSSANRAFDALIAPYKHVGGAPLGERKLWLHDDYVKFFRRAEELARQAPSAIVAFVTNHGYLENPTFRGMRESLLATFPRTWVLDLHGSANKRERGPAHADDENVFSIRQGVAVAFLVKPPGTSMRRVARADLYGARDAKLAFLTTETVASTSFVELTPTAPFHLLTRDHEAELPELRRAFSLDAIFPERVAGIVTARDRVVVDVERAALLARIAELRDPKLTDAELRARYFRARTGARHPVGDTRSFSLTKARAALAADRRYRSRVVPVLAAPFDVRSLYVGSRMVDWPRAALDEHLALAGNVALVAPRSVEIQREFEHAFVTRVRALHHAVSQKEVNYVFPLYVARDGERRANLGASFTSSLAGVLGEVLPAPEAILGYAYALLWSPLYRARFRAPLRREPAKIPLPHARATFWAVAELGSELVRAHLLEREELELGTVTEDELERFTVGGSRVLASFRRARAHLAPSAVAKPLRAISAAIAATLRLQRAIDERLLAAGGFPGAFLQ